jgi:hypothetical protein
MNDREIERLIRELREEDNQDYTEISSLRPRFHYSGIPEKDFESFGIR